MVRKNSIIIIVLLIVVGLIVFVQKAFKDFGAGLAPNNQICLVDFMDSKYRTSTIRNYLDTFFIYHPGYDATQFGYKVDDYERELSVKKFYFSTEPKEVYSVRVDFPICIWATNNISTSRSLVFSANEREEEMKTNAQELKRIQTRFQKEVLDTVFHYIEQSNLSDSFKYKE